MGVSSVCGGENLQRTYIIDYSGICVTDTPLNLKGPGYMSTQKNIFKI